MPRRRAAILTLLTAAVLAAIALGRGWVPRKPEADADAPLERLRALGYVEWAEVPDGERGRRGVTRNLPGSAPGFVFYHSRTRTRAQLLAADGHFLHSWRGRETRGGWHHVELMDDGGLLVVRRDGVLARLDARSGVLWERSLGAHHDVAVTAEGEIHVLTHELGEMPFGSGRIPVVRDFVTTLSRDGPPLGRIDLLELLRDRVPAARLQAIAERPPGELLEAKRPLHGLPDVLHANSVELLERDVAGLGRRGDLLLGVRELDLVAVVDVRGERIVWSFGPGELDRPHQPTLLASGNVLVFDNGPGRGFSRVVEVDPVARAIVWEYAASPGARFHSRKMGGCQGLPNGNVLITESEAGRAFEVDRRGRVVWEFYNPELDAKGRKRAAIHRLSKLEPGRIAQMFDGAVVEKSSNRPW